MPARDDIQSILIIGAGPIVIGQACEFDYSGVQACRVLKQEGYRVILANSNPATIMTDPDFADATYLEPLTADILEAIIEKENPDALLPTLGGQTALNLTMELFERGALNKEGGKAEKEVELLGANMDAISTAENRAAFKTAMTEIGLTLPKSVPAGSLEEAQEAVQQTGLPAIVRPGFILGGAGAGIAENQTEFRQMVERGLAVSPISQVLVEEAVVGWKEFELEVMRDKKDNCVVVCSIENLDPMGVHTGDSITVAPAQTLTDVEYQEMRDDAFKCIRRVGVETGGSNIQFAVNPADGRRVVIEMNPRVSRSSALASKATGFPIAKIATKLAVGFTLDEIPNDITKATPACFEPSIDYVVTKIPRFTFEKFPGTSGVLGASMQSVGEAMAIGRTFPESLQKAVRSLETDRAGLNADSLEDKREDGAFGKETDMEKLAKECATPTPERIFKLETAIRKGHSLEELQKLTGIDRWFLNQIARISSERKRLEDMKAENLKPRDWRRAKQLGFSDSQLSFILGENKSADTDIAAKEKREEEGEEEGEEDIRKKRIQSGVSPVYKTVDTCAAEFSAETPYYYSTYEDESELKSSKKGKVIILGAGPNRIGQGIEFDYCCVHASFALKEMGLETIMVNCNPETVSTDYDTSDRLYFEPLTREDVLNILEVEKQGAKNLKVIVSLGGQTPLKLAGHIPSELIAGTSADSIDLAEDRHRWAELCRRLQIPAPEGDTADSPDVAVNVADTIGYPLLFRPSYVLGGRHMEIIYNQAELEKSLQNYSGSHSVLLDKFLEDAVEVDVDALRDQKGEVFIGGIMEHIEEAGIHSGDSACVLPPISLSETARQKIEKYTHQIADALGVVGLINIQFGVVDNKEVYVFEANPRASRTVPFVSKATGIPLAKIATRLMMGETLGKLRRKRHLPKKLASGLNELKHISVKEAVLPFDRFLDSDAVLGPEMRSTGEVMSIDTTPGLAFGKSQIAAGGDLSKDLSKKGSVFISLSDRHKQEGTAVAKRLRAMGFNLAATTGTAAAFQAEGIEVVAIVPKLAEIRVERAEQGDQGNKDIKDPEAKDHEIGDVVTLIKSGQIAFVINTPRGLGPKADGARIRRAATEENILLFTTISAAEAAVSSLEELEEFEFKVCSLQDYHGAK